MITLTKVFSGLLPPKSRFSFGCLETGLNQINIIFKPYFTVYRAFSLVHITNTFTNITLSFNSPVPWFQWLVINDHQYMIPVISNQWSFRPWFQYSIITSATIPGSVINDHQYYDSSDQLSPVLWFQWSVINDHPDHDSSDQWSIITSTIISEISDKWSPVLWFQWSMITSIMIPVISDQWSPGPWFQWSVINDHLDHDSSDQW